MVDFSKLVGSITGHGVGAGVAGGVAGGALVSALTTKSGRKAAKSVAKIGGLAAVGALAWGAYKKYQSGNAGPGAGVADAGTITAPASGASTVWQGLPQGQFDELASNPESSPALLILRTMICAAMADGHLSPNEQARIFERLDVLGLSQEERGMLFDELRNPLSCNALAAQVTDPVTAIEVYTAAVMTLDMSCKSAEGFLGELSGGLNLPASLVSSIHNAAAAGQPVLT